jgi:hypothetical protein
MSFNARCDALVNKLKPVLAGNPPAEQSAALAECLAIWLAGHIIDGDERATFELRAQLLANHLQLVGELLSLITNAKSDLE